VAIEFTDSVNVGNELVGVGELPHHLDLEILLWLGNVNSIVLGKAFEEMHPLMDQPIPGLSLFVRKRSIAESTPLPKECRATIVTAEIGLQRFFKAAAEDHGGPGLLFAPAVQVAMAIAARAAQVSPGHSRWMKS